MAPNASVQPRRHVSRECLQHMIARKMAPISLDAQRRRLERIVGRLYRLGFDTDKSTRLD